MRRLHKNAVRNALPKDDLNTGSEKVSNLDDNVSDVMSIGDDSTVVDSKQRETDSNWRPYQIWLQGLAISLVPILMYPLYTIIADQSSFSSFFRQIIQSSEIIYLAITLCVSSINDATAIKQWPRYRLWNGAVFIFIILAAVVFGALSICEKTLDDINTSFVFWLNLVLLIVSIIAGSIPYFILCMRKERTA